MDIRATQTVTLRRCDGSTYRLETGQSMTVLDGDGCYALFQAPEAVRVNSPVLLGPGCAVMWSTGATTLGPGHVLARMTHDGEDWLLVHFQGSGHVVRVADVLDVNPHLPLRAAFDVMNRDESSQRRAVAEAFMSAILSDHRI